MRSFLHVIRNFFGVFLDALVFIRLCLRPTVGVAAENLFLRKQLGLYMEREVKPRRATDSIRFTLARLSRWFDWRQALIVVKPDTLIRWHRKGLPPVLEMEIPASWPSVRNRRRPEAHRRHGRKQSDLG